MAGFEWTQELEEAVDRLARQALEEDRASHDITTGVCVPADCHCHAMIKARKATVLAGARIPESVLRCFGATAEVSVHHEDGQRVSAGECWIELRGRAAPILSCERTILNFLQRLCGIATLTYEFVQEVREYRVEIVDTRKTTPGWRLLEKYAVRCGGGVNHRLHLADMIMIKDNHVALGALTLREMVYRARARYPRLPLACEADTLVQVEELLCLPVDILMLDNMSPEEVAEAVRLCGGKVCLEVTGGVTLANIRAYAATGVSRISVGALTHSAPAADLGMEIVPL